METLPGQQSVVYYESGSTVGWPAPIRPRHGDNASLSTILWRNLRPRNMFPVKILLVFQDNLFSGVAGVQADFLSTGNSFTSGTPAQKSSLSNASFARTAWRLFTGYYDWALLPAIDLNWPWDQNQRKKRLRDFVRRALRSKLMCSIVKLLWPRKTRVAILDRYDTWKPFLEVPRLFGAVLYFKGHYVPGETPSEAGMRYERLPWWIFPENYRDRIPILERRHDLFFGMSMSSDIRREAREMADSFRGEGLEVFLPEKPLAFDEYTTALADSRFVLAPEGTGYCCFRHYEGMLSGAIPVVNENTRGYDLDLIDGENCIFYRRGDRRELLHRLQSLLRDQQALESFARRARESALANNTQKAVGNYLLLALLDFATAGHSSGKSSAC